MTPQPNTRTQCHFTPYYISSKGWNQTIAAVGAPGTEPRGCDGGGTAQAPMFLEGSSLDAPPAHASRARPSAAAGSVPSSWADPRGTEPCSSASRTPPPPLPAFAASQYCFYKPLISQKLWVGGSVEFSLFACCFSQSH